MVISNWEGRPEISLMTTWPCWILAFRAEVCLLWLGRHTKLTFFSVRPFCVEKEKVNS